VFPESGFTLVLSEPRRTSAVFSQCCFVVPRIVAAVKSRLKPLKPVKPSYPKAKAPGLYGLECKTTRTTGARRSMYLAMAAPPPCAWMSARPAPPLRQDSCHQAQVAEPATAVAWQTTSRLRSDHARAGSKPLSLANS